MAEAHNDPCFDALLEEQINRIGGCPVCIHRVIAPHQQYVAVSCKQQATYPECRSRARFELDENA